MTTAPTSWRPDTGPANGPRGGAERAGACGERFAARRDLDAALAEVEGALATVAAAVDARDPAGLAHAVIALLEMQHRLAALVGQTLRRYEDSGAWADDGARSLRHWLLARTTMGEESAGALVRLAATLRRLPVLADALAHGATTPEHLQAVSALHDRYPSLSGALTELEPDAARLAATVPPDHLRRWLLDRLHRIDPAAVDGADAARLRREPAVRIADLPDGWGRVSMTLPPEAFAQWQTLLESAALVAPTPDATPGAAPGRTADGEPADRPAAGAQADLPADEDSPPAAVAGEPARPPASARRFDALLRMMRAAASAGGSARLPDVHGARPTVQVSITLEALAADRAAPGVTSGRLRRSGQAGEGCVLGAEAARRLSCDGAVQRLLLSPAGQVVDVGRTSRTVPPALRLAVEHRDGRTCRFPGCRGPIDEVHHVVHWARGGRTDRSNCLGLCWFHHHLVHEGAWALAGDANRVVVFRPPRPVAAGRASQGRGHPLVSRPARR